MKQFLKTIKVMIVMTVFGMGILSQSVYADNLSSMESQLSTYEKQIDELEQKQISAFAIVQSAKDLELEDKNPIIVKASEIWFQAYQEKQELLEKYENFKKEYEKEKVNAEKAKAPSYSEEDLTLLAKLIYAEAGSNWLTDEHQQLVGNVVLNRVKSSKFPNTLEGVIYQSGQYSTAKKLKNITPDARTINNAKILLEGTRVCPDDILYQANFPQGTYTYKVINDSVLGKTYFCGG